MALIPGRARVTGAGLLLLLGCAQVGPPPGGPIDATGPSVVGVRPESLAVGVPVDAPLEIVFSEGVDEKTLERALWVTPGGVSKPRIDVGGNRATIRLGTPYPESTTVGVLITTALKDRRTGSENRLAGPVRWIFSTGDSLWSGRIRGKVERVGLTAGQGQVLVALYADPGDTLPNPAEEEPVAITEADTSGAYDLFGLPTDGGRRWLYALYDRDGNRQIGGTGEFQSERPDTVVLTRGDPELIRGLRLVDPKAPATLLGTLVKSTPDTVVMGVELWAAGEDSAQTPISKGKVTKTGGFTLASVPPGTYGLFVYCDLDGDGRRDPEETVHGYGEVILAPGLRHELGSWTIPGCLP